MPSYVKTIQQIARNLGDAIKTDVKDNGQVIEHYSDGYKLHRHDGGTDLIDKDGNILYNDSPTIKGYTRRTFSEGDLRNCIKQVLESQMSLYICSMEKNWYRSRSW